jgi:hypothetical protein
MAHEHYVPSSLAILAKDELVCVRFSGAEGLRFFGVSVCLVEVLKFNIYVGIFVLF